MRGHRCCCFGKCPPKIPVGPSNLPKHILLRTSSTLGFSFQLLISGTENGDENRKDPRKTIAPRKDSQAVATSSPTLPAPHSACGLDPGFSRLEGNHQQTNGPCFKLLGSVTPKKNGRQGREGRGRKARFFTRVAGLLIDDFGCFLLDLTPRKSLSPTNWKKLNMVFTPKVFFPLVKLFEVSKMLDYDC